MSGKESKSNREQVSSWVSTAVAIVMFFVWIGAAKNLSGMEGLETWQKILPLLAIGGTAIIAVVSIRLCRRGRSSLGIMLILAGLMITTIIVPFIVAERATLFALVTMVLIIAIATQGLSQKQSNRAIIIGSIFMVVTVLLDWWGLMPRVTPDLTSTPIIAMAVGTGLLFAGVLIRYRFLALRSKLMVIMMMTPIIVTTVVGGYFIAQLTNRLNNELKLYYHLDGESKVNDLKNFLQVTESDIFFLSQSSVLTAYLSAVEEGDSAKIASSLAMLNEEFRTFAETRQIYDQVRFIDKTGQEVVRVNNSSNGTASIVDAADLQNKSGRYYFDDTIELRPGELMISKLDLNMEHGEIEKPHKPMLRYGTPVIFNGTVKGIIVTNVLAQNFLNLLDDNDDELQTYLLDEDGYYLYHPDEEQRWGQDLGTGIKFEDDEIGIKAALLTGRSGSISTDSDIFTYQPVTIPGEGSPRWYLLNSASQDVIFAPIMEVLTPVQSVLAIALLLVPIIAVSFSHIVTKPIVSITRSAEDVAAGNLNATLVVDTEDEIGILAQSFNMMTERLRTLVGSLETQVAQRTRGLELSAEIGSQLIQITDQRELLETAVNIIGTQFRMYYTQIYLVDALGHTLRLQAGTGEIGEELMRRAHYLPIGTGSINGMAAAEQKTIVIEDTRNSPLFRSNALLPHTRSEMAVPLLIGSTLIGTLNMQADQPGVLAKSNSIIFNVLASQLTAALQNSNLFAETINAQASIEAQTRRITHDSWGDYLNAVDRREHITYRYDQIESTLINEEITEIRERQNGMETAVSVNNEAVGIIQLLGHRDQEWTDDDRNLVKLVSQQVGQHIENLRLLDETARYRAEAEQALRRMTRDGWASFQKRNVEMAALGYVYDGKGAAAVQGEGESRFADTIALKSVPLVVGGQEIGSLLVADTEEEKGTAVLLEQVAVQLSNHIETLRLENQTEAALADAQRRSREMAQLNAIVTKVSQTLDLKESLRIVVEELVTTLDIAQSSITLMDNARENLVIIASYPSGREVEGVVIPIEGNILTQRVLKTRQYACVEDVQNNPLMRNLHDIFRQWDIVTVFVFPMIVNDEVIGTVGLDVKQSGQPLTEEQLQLAGTIITQTATIVQNARLFEQTEKALAEAKQRGKEVETVNRIAQIVSQQLELEQILQVVYEQIKRVMDTDSFLIAIYNREQNIMEYPVIYEHNVRVEQQALALNPASYIYKVIHTGKPLMETLTPEKIEAVIESDIIIGDVENTGISSLLYAPLMIGEMVTGVLSVQSYQQDAYNEADLSLLVGVANYVAVAMEKARLFDQTRKRARREQTLREVAAQIHTAVDAESILRIAAAEINRALGLEITVYLDAPSKSGAASKMDRGLSDD